MVASTDIKFYVHSNNNAPQLQNAYGSMIGVLDACLVNGISLGLVSSLTAMGTTVTAVFSTAHNLMQYQVFKIVGANQAEYNGEHRILTVPNATSVTFQLASVPSVTTATGTISASLPPLGWEKPFSSTNEVGGGKAAYRSNNVLLPSRPFLRVVDERAPAYSASYAKYAKVGIVEDMGDIDTMFGVQAPYDVSKPGKNWDSTGASSNVINGWAKWYYARIDPLLNGNDTNSPANARREWLVVGSEDYFYVFNNTDPANLTRIAYGFGAFESYIAADISSNFLAATLQDSVASSFVSLSTLSSIASDYNVLCLQRDYTQMAKPVNNAKITSLFTGGSGYTNKITAPASSNHIPSAPIFINDGTLRGKLPLIHWLFQATPYVENSLIVDGEKVFLALKTLSVALSVGQILVRIA